MNFKITVERSYLANALNVAGKAVSSRNTLPILSHVLLLAKDDRLHLTTTDLDTAIKCAIPASIIEDGATCVQVGQINDYVSKLPDGPITLELSEGKLFIRSGKSKFTMMTSPAEDFPETAVVTQGTDLTLPASTLKEMLRLTTFAASKEESRSLLMGVLFEARGKWLTLVATDTHRLSLKKMEMPEAVAVPVSVIVPAKPLIELERLLKASGDEMVTIRFGSNQALFQTQDVTLTSRVLDGQFPNYEKVMPKQTERKAFFSAKEMGSAISRVDLVSRTASQKAIFDFQTGNDAITIKAESAEAGKVEESVKVEFEGGNLAVGYNTKYFSEVLKVVDVPDNGVMELRMNGALNPGLLSIKGDDSWVYVVMPMQL